MIQADGMLDYATAGNVTDTLSSQIVDFDPTIAAEFQYPVEAIKTFLGVPLLECDSLLNLGIRFVLNFLVTWILVHFMYYKKSKRLDYYVTFMLFSSTMFLLIFLLDNVKLQIGFTLGLFAIFGMIRYRTETVPIREMTYLFVIIGLSVINGLAMTVSWAELLVTNGILIGLALFFENWKGLPHRSAKIILYEKVENIVPERRQELIDDIEQRVGLKVDDLEIGHIDFLRDVVYIKVYYTLKKGETNTIDNQVKPK